MCDAKVLRWKGQHVNAAKIQMSLLKMLQVYDGAEDTEMVLKAAFSMFPVVLSKPRWFT